MRPLALTHHDGSFAAAAQQPRLAVRCVRSADESWRDAGNGSLIEDFVARSGTRFVVQSRNGSKGDCETFYFSGANANYMVRRPQGPYRQQPRWVALGLPAQLVIKPMSDWRTGQLSCKRWLVTCGGLLGPHVAGGSGPAQPACYRFGWSWSVPACCVWRAARSQRWWGPAWRVAAWLRF